ncbi:preprotein translocase subunit SecG [Caulobacter sp. LARHSG274]
MLIGVLLTINIIVCIALIFVVLMQRSEGGALGMGGGGGFMTARGAGDLLTRTTWILFSIFLVISLALTVLTGRMGASNSVVDRLKLDGLDTKTLNAPVLPSAPAVPAPTAPSTTAPATTAPAAITAPTPQISAPTPSVSAPAVSTPKPAAAAAKPPAKAAAKVPVITPAAPPPVVSVPAATPSQPPAQ